MDLNQLASIMNPVGITDKQLVQNATIVLTLGKRGLLVDAMAGKATLDEKQRSALSTLAFLQDVGLAAKQIYCEKEGCDRDGAMTLVWIAGENRFGFRCPCRSTASVLKGTSLLRLSSISRLNLRFLQTSF